jgi:hypothetical protein
MFSIAIGRLYSSQDGKSQRALEVELDHPFEHRELAPETGSPFRERVL